MKKILAITILCASAACAMAQSETLRTSTKFMEHLDMSVEVGSTGIGVDVAMPIFKSVQVRMGFTYMPRFESTLHFPIQIGENTTQEEQESKFNNLADVLEEFSGYRVDNEVDMIAKPTFWNFKFLVDVYPFHNKKWFFTAGFYLGPSKIAEAYNSTEEMTSLVSVGMYNMMYLKALNDEPIYNGYYIEALNEKFLSYGRMYSPQGTIKGLTEDDPGYINGLEPDENGMMKAKSTVNSFRPYVGVGYSHDFGKTKQYSFGVNAGVMFWGGHPSVVTKNSYYYVEDYVEPEDPKAGKATTRHQREVDLTRDVENMNVGRVKDYVDILKQFTVYPVINIRLAKRIF